MMLRLLCVVALAAVAGACTNILVSTSASTEGGALLGDNDDTAKRFGGVTHFAAAAWPQGATRDIYDFETGVFRGVISQPAHTVIPSYCFIFNVVDAMINLLRFFMIVECDGWIQ